MKRPTRMPLTKEQRKKYKGWIIIYVPDMDKRKKCKKSGEIVHLEKVNGKERDLGKIGKLFKLYKHKVLGFELVK